MFFKILCWNPNFRPVPAHILGMNRKERLNNLFLTDSARFAHLRNLDPELPEHVWQVIIRYTPQLSHTQWEAVREFTLANAVLMKPRTFENVRRLMSMSARFNAWVWTTSGCTLTTERVYTQNNVYRFLQNRLTKHSEMYRWGIVRQLGTIAETLAATDIKRLPSPLLPGKRLPFSMPETATLHSWASTLSTTLKRQNAWALLGLAGGAGLRSDEIVETRLSDIELVNEQLFVNVPGPRARRVPVRHPWNRTLHRSLAGRSNPEEYVFRGYRHEEYRPRAIQTFLTDHPGPVRATISRLRSTWVCTQLEADVPTDIIMTIAGFRSAGSLDLHLAHLPKRSIDNHVGRITGEASA
jgi:integrase